MEKLPRYRVNKGLHFSEQEMRDFIDTTNEWTEDSEMKEKEKQKTEDFKEKMHRFIDQHIEWIREHLKLDVSERRPTEEKIYLYHPNSLKKYFNNEGGQASINPASKEIRIAEPSRFQPLEKTFQDLSHELTHAFSDTRFFLRKNLGEGTEELEPETFQFGYYNMRKKKFLLLNEGITEMLSLTILEEMKRKGETYKKKDYSTYDYERILLQIIIEKAAAANKKTVEEIKLHLYKGYILGDNSYLRILHTLLGTEGFRYLSDLKPSNDYENYAERCKKLGIDFEEFKRHLDTT